MNNNEQKVNIMNIMNIMNSTQEMQISTWDSNIVMNSDQRSWGIVIQLIQQLLVLEKIDVKTQKFGEI